MKRNITEGAGPLRIIPLGGLDQIGMNITVFEYEDSIMIVDCGLGFPEDDMYGVDLVIPDVTYLEERHCPMCCGSWQCPSMPQGLR